MLGIREPEIYGDKTYAYLKKMIEDKAKEMGIEVEIFQSNHEGVIVDEIQNSFYDGTNGNAGEVGHIRLCDTGPMGYGKCGSFEGFCSGGGIAQLGYTLALEALQSGASPAYFKEGMTASDVNAKSIAEAAVSGDPTAREVYRLSGEYLGRGLSLLIDILNPEVIVIGSIFARSRDLLWDAAQKAIRKDALPFAARACRIVPAALGERIGDYAALATALLQDNER